MCALCRFLDVVAQDEAIEGIMDTEYTVFHCTKLNILRYEEYLMAPVTENLEDTKSKACPYWEPWKTDAVPARESKHIGLPDRDDLPELSPQELSDLLEALLAAPPPPPPETSA